MQSIKIERISLDLAGNKIELSIEQAKELQKILNELFTSRPTATEKDNQIVVYPMIYPSQPQSPTIPEFPYQGWQTWCDNSGSLTCKLT